MDKTYTGFINSYSSKTNSGTIFCSELNKNFEFQKTNCLSSYKKIYVHDKVRFILYPDDNTIKNIEYTANQTLEYLKKDFANGCIKKGVLKLISGGYKVIDNESGIPIKIRISSYETQLKENYQNRINKPIEYKIISFSNTNKIIAINCGRTFIPEFKLATSGSPIEGKIKSKLPQGIQIVICDIIEGFIPNSFLNSDHYNFLSNMNILVTFDKHKETSDSIVFRPV